MSENGGKKKPIELYSAWTIGYDGLSAVVDRGAMLSFGKGAPVEALLKKGLYRAAAAAAVHSANAEKEISAVIGAYNAACKEGGEYKPEDIYRLFGIQRVDASRFTLL